MTSRPLIAIRWLNAITEWEAMREDTPFQDRTFRSVALGLFQCCNPDGTGCMTGARALAIRCGVHKDTVCALRRRWVEHGWLVDTGIRKFGGVAVYELSIADRTPDENITNKVVPFNGHLAPLHDGHLAQGVPKRVPKSRDLPPDLTNTKERGERPPSKQQGLPGVAQKKSKPVRPHAEVVRAFDELFRRHCAGAKPSWGKRSHGQIATLLKKHDASEIIRRAEIMFEVPRKWPAGPYALGDLVTHFDKFTLRPTQIGPSGQEMGDIQ